MKKKILASIIMTVLLITGCSSVDAKTTDDSFNVDKKDIIPAVTKEEYEAWKDSGPEMPGVGNLAITISDKYEVKGGKAHKVIAPDGKAILVSDVDGKTTDKWGLESLDDGTKLEVLAIFKGAGFTEEDGTSPRTFVINLKDAKVIKSEEENKEEKKEEPKEEKKEEVKEEAKKDDTYIIADSNSRYLGEEEILKLDKPTMRLARNEIFARHGAKFEDKELSDFFSTKSWYNPTVSISEVKLSEVEDENVALLNLIENDFELSEEERAYTTSTEVGSSSTFDRSRLIDMVNPSGYSSNYNRFIKINCVQASSFSMDIYNAETSMPLYTLYFNISDDGSFTDSQSEGVTGKIYSTNDFEIYTNPGNDPDLAGHFWINAG